MQLTFLGTGTSQGVPVIGCRCEVCTSADPRDNRLRTSAMVSINGKNIVIDTGPDFRQQMLRANPPNIDAVLFTHEHKDHIAGLDDIRPFNFQTGRPLEIYAGQRVQAALKREFHYVFSDEKYPGVPEVNLHNIEPNEDFEVEGIPVVPVEVMHYKLPVLGFRIADTAYITDANFIDATQKAKLHNLDILVVNALRKMEHISHFNLSEAVKLVEELKPKRAYFTHISHLMGKHEKVMQELPENIFIAYDGLIVEA